MLWREADRTEDWKALGNRLMWVASHVMSRLVLLLRAKSGSTALLQQGSVLMSVVS